MTFKLFGIVWDFTQFIIAAWCFLSLMLIGWTFMLPHAPWWANLTWGVTSVVFLSTASSVNKIFEGWMKHDS